MHIFITDSFLLWTLCGAVLGCLLVHLAYKMILKTDEEVFRRQTLLDSDPEEWDRLHSRQRKISQRVSIVEPEATAKQPKMKH